MVISFIQILILRWRLTAVPEMQVEAEMKKCFPKVIILTCIRNKLLLSILYKKTTVLYQISMLALFALFLCWRLSAELYIKNCLFS